MKELPYFKFNSAEWISGEITLEDLTTQGVFINICAYYWFKAGSLTLSEIKRRVKCKQAIFDRLIEQNLIKVDGDLIEISFLKAQLDERGHISKKNSENGKLGGAPRGNKNAEKNNPKQPKTTNIEERREEKNKIREEENFKDWQRWADSIIRNEDQYWEAMRGRKVTEDEMNQFLSVATRNNWKINTQQDFRISLNGFKVNGNGNGHAKINPNPNKIQ